jgi:hypothetical protein
LKSRTLSGCCPIPNKKGTHPAYLAGASRFTRTPLRFLVICAVLAFVSGCQTYNPNLGAPSVLASQVTFISPAAKRAGDPGFTLVINGAGFVDGSAVQWNGSNRSTTFVSANEVDASITASDIASAGTFQVRVLAPGVNEGNNYSNIVSFLVCSGACPQVSGTSAQIISAQSSQAAYSPAISADGRYVAFASVSGNPSENASTGTKKIYLRDTCQGSTSACQPSTTLVSVALQGGEPNGDSRTPSISADGRYVAFASDAGDLIENDLNGVADVFLRDTCIGVGSDCKASTIRISIAADGSQSNGASSSPSISADGRYVAFDSEAQNLVPDGSPAPVASYLRDTCRAATQPCSPSTTRLAISSPAR